MGIWRKIASSGQAPPAGKDQERKATAGIITFIIAFILRETWWNLEYSYLLRLSFGMEMASSLMALIFVLGYLQLFV